jgi:rRNA maturation endonuclease Nob1
MGQSNLRPYALKRCWKCGVHFRIYQDDCPGCGMKLHKIAEAKDELHNNH